MLIEASNSNRKTINIHRNSTAGKERNETEKVNIIMSFTLISNMHKIQHSEIAAQKLTYNSSLPPHKIASDDDDDDEIDIYIYI